MTDFPQQVVFWSSIYLLVLLVLGLLGRWARRKHTLSDHFLAGRSIGFGILLMTLFATQYSGNSLVGFPGKAWRGGLAYFMSVTFMVAIVAGYTLFVPRLFRQARKKSFVTPCDFLNDRWQSSGLHWLATFIFVLTLANFLLAQLIALGSAFSGITSGLVSYEQAILVGAAVILICEWLGGMRTVAWTDALQGVLLLLGLGIILVLVTRFVGTPLAIVERVAQVAPQKVSPPSLEVCTRWLSTFLLLGLGASIYPQAIQRIYAAKSLKALKRSLAVMAFLPLFAVAVVVWLGITGIALFPQLTWQQSEQVTFLVLEHLVSLDSSALIPVILVMMAVSAAIMSTADSALLSLSSIFTRDVAGRLRGLSPQESEGQTRLAQFFSLVIIGFLAFVALQRPGTLWNILILKFEILIQLSPAILLGVWTAKEKTYFQARDILRGCWLGLAFTLVFYFAGVRAISGLSVGVLGLGLNWLVIFLSKYLSHRHPAT